MTERSRRPENLALELDGAGHFTEEGLQKDAIRTAYLNECGITVIRFENKLVFEKTDWVLEEIRKRFKKEQEHHPVTTRRDTPPKGGEPEAGTG